VKWATRANIHIDRAACVWLIRRAVDPDAEFVFLGVCAGLGLIAGLAGLPVA
jgi:hypothetical protein